MYTMLLRGWCSSADAGTCLCLWGSASGIATSTVLHISQQIHPSFGHDHTTSWAWTCYGRWKSPAEITARIVTSSETACGKNASPLIRSVNASQGRRDSGRLSNLVIYSLYS